MGFRGFWVSHFTWVLLVIAQGVLLHLPSRSFGSQADTGRMNPRDCEAQVDSMPDLIARRSLVAELVRANTLAPQADFYIALALTAHFIRSPFSPALLREPATEAEINEVIQAMDRAHQAFSVSSHAGPQEVRRLIEGFFGFGVFELGLTKFLDPGEPDRVTALVMIFSQGSSSAVIQQMRKFAAAVDQLLTSPEVGDLTKRWRLTLQQMNATQAEVGVVSEGQGPKFRQQVLAKAKEFNQELFELYQNKVVDSLPPIEREVALEIARPHFRRGSSQ